MKKLALFLFVAFFASCSEDSDDKDFRNSCTCYIYQERGNEKIPTGITDCSYNGKVISQAIGTRYICE
jgi:hypothetical protein